jgi:DNA-binding SARP family transcriptional activator
LVEFRILGPLQVVSAGGPVVPRGRRQATVLGLLLAHPDQVMSMEYLVDAVWDDRPPATAKRQLQNDISALRRTLSAGSADPVIVLDGAGYRVRIQPGELDAQVFRDHVATGLRLADQRPAAAVAELRAGLGLWRGPALLGLTGRVVEAVAAGLGEQRLAAAERCFELELHLGRHAEVAGELTDLVLAHPVRERLVELLMLARYRSGRRSDALAAYHHLRERLADEIGVDPGPPVQRLYTAILRGDPTIDAPPTELDLARADDPAVPETGAVPESGGVPAQLPADIAGFTGRAEHTKVLDELLDDDPGGNGTAMTLLTITGMPGIGKTALAVHWGHGVADRFPDGQL